MVCTSGLGKWQFNFSYFVDACFGVFFLDSLPEASFFFSSRLTPSSFSPFQGEASVTLPVLVICSVVVVLFVGSFCCFCLFFFLRCLGSANPFDNTGRSLSVLFRFFFPTVILVKDSRAPETPFGRTLFPPTDFFSWARRSGSFFFLFLRYSLNFGLPPPPQQQFWPLSPWFFAVVFLDLPFPFSGPYLGPPNSVRVPPPPLPQSFFCLSFVPGDPRLVRFSRTFGLAPFFFILSFSPCSMSPLPPPRL